mmetsp:Transcript_103/g.193  ORF Transcript_103/g.193 Transcript_103/m.193 type:complete len:90 (-) Transcript_103:598-867(-)
MRAFSAFTDDWPAGVGAQLLAKISAVFFLYDAVLSWLSCLLPSVLPCFFHSLHLTSHHLLHRETSGSAFSLRCPAARVMRVIGSVMSVH